MAPPIARRAGVRFRRRSPHLRGRCAVRRSRRAARPDFAIDDGNAGAVADICHRLDGIPLALELAAARTVAMSPADVASRLDERFRLLTGGRSTSIERHQTLQAAVDWSYSLLDETERMVFDRLAVFSGTFDAAAVEAIVAGDDMEGWDVFDAVTGLVAKSMVATEPGPQDTMRYQLLETMRQYAHKRLDESGDVERWRRRHAAHYASLTERLVAGMRGIDESAWRQQLDAELDNVHAAVNWGLDAPDDSDADLALRIIAALSFETTFNRMIGVGEWATRALERAASAPPARRSDIFGSAAYRAFVLGDHERGRELARLAIQDGVHADSWSPGLGYVTLAYTALAIGEHEQVLPLVQEAAQQIEAARCDEWKRLSLAWTKSSYEALLGVPQAREHAEQLVRDARRLGNPTAIGNSLHALGWSLSRESPAEALAVFEEAIAVMAAANDNLVTSGLGMLAQLRARHGDRQGALKALRLSTVKGYEIGERAQFVATIGWGVYVLARFGHFEQAAVLAGALVDGPLAELSHYPGVARTHGDRALSPIEQALGADSYRVATARGAEMTYDEIVAFMLTEVDRLLAEPEAPA